jgi:hypothetical protein
MDDETYLPERESVAAHKERIDGRDAASADDLLFSLLAHCWPTKATQDA